MKVLIVGHGFVGKAVDYGFSHPAIEKTIVDPKYGTSIHDVNVDLFQLVFVCVPTPMDDSGNIHTGIIDSVTSSLTRAQLVVVKSTVTPDVVKDWPEQFVYNPEFLTEKSAAEQFVDPQFHVLGGVKWATEKVEEIFNEYSLCNPCPVMHMTREEASLVKYTINSFLAMKVAFFNQLYDTCMDSQADFTKVIKTVGLDNRIGSSHTKVPGFDGKRGFGGACFPKDTSALVKYTDKMSLLQSVININNDYRKHYELDEREVEQSINYDN